MKQTSDMKQESSHIVQKTKRVLRSDSDETLSVPSLMEIKKTIPADCFKPSLLKSLSYVAWDISLVLFCFLIMRVANNLSIVNILMWPVYWIAQGTLFWAIFVLGHDCGHGSFSRSKWINDFFGTILHSFILVPYHMWRLSHKHHHKNTGNFEKDEIFYPEPVHPERKKIEEIRSFQENYFFLGVGFIIYLMFGYAPRNNSHFNPWGPLYRPHLMASISSLVSWILMASILVAYGYHYGWMKLIGYYVIPWLVFASWLVVTTFLHHNEPGVPWYSSRKWNYVLGNLSSVDRDYGIFHNVTHNIGTHQVHHLFPTIPHYKLQEATKYFRAEYPDLSRVSNESIIISFLRNCRIFAEQHFFHASLEVFSYEDQRLKTSTYTQ